MTYFPTSRHILREETPHLSGAESDELIRSCIAAATTVVSKDKNKRKRVDVGNEEEDPSSKRSLYLNVIKVCWNGLPNYVNKDNPQRSCFPSDGSYTYDDFLSDTASAIQLELNCGLASAEFFNRFTKESTSLFSKSGKSWILCFNLKH